MNRHTLGPIQFTGTGGFILHQLPDRQITHDLRFVENTSAGVPDRGFVAIGSASPKITGGSLEIERFLTKISPLKGLAIPKTSPQILACNIFYTKKEEQGDRTTGSTHLKVSPSLALIVPRQLTAEHGAEARITYELIGISADGKTIGWPYTNNVALPTPLPAFEKFTLGPVFIDDVMMDSNIGFTWDFGLEVEAVSSHHAVLPMSVNIKTRMPRGTVRTLDMTSLATYGISGGQPAVDLYLVKLKENSDRYADTDAVHIKLSANEANTLVTLGGAQGADNADQNLELSIIPTIGTSPIFSVTPLQVLP